MMRYKVVIVGAGLAGLGAALKLHEAGCNEIVIVEAEQVAGGRLKTIDFQDGHLELGAQWIHDQRNSLYDLAYKHQLISLEKSEEAGGVYVRDDGMVLNDFLVKRIDFEIGRILEDCEKFIDSPDHPASVGQFLHTEFLHYLNSLDDESDVREIKMQLYHWHVKFQLIDNSCTSLDELSAKSWGAYKCSGQNNGQTHINLQNGYRSLIDLMTKSLPKNAIRLNTPVLNIYWNNPGKVIVECENNRLECDHVIVTASLGVLKNSPNLFNPPLPHPLSDAINHLGFSAIGKVFLIFEYKWWKVEGFQLVWREEIADSALEWTKWITGFDSIVGHSNVLMGWVGGSGVQVMENLSDETVGEHCHQVISLFLQKQIPSPIRTIK